MNKLPEELVRIPTDGVELEGDLVVPPSAAGLVIFAHGSGSSRRSPRNRAVAERLQVEGFATLLFDLLTRTEDLDYANRFDILLLTRRLLASTEWARHEISLAGLPIGYFGASTGAATALQAAAVLREVVRAVVSRGGRPDLAGDALGAVVAPTLLIVGGFDHVVLRLNRDAYSRMRAPRELAIVPGATHLFEEPGTLDRVTDLAIRWFKDHLLVREEPRCASCL
ncbi:MAG: dienelactone hydrolase family protein [Deltaproteobacteria bacterium]|nr:dienelactone hydrolase family protein [Deltaproteobacteria bacterium]